MKICLCILIALTLSATAGPSDNAAGQELPPQSRPIDDVLVPVPREVFNALDKFGNSNWVEVQRRDLPRWKTRGDQAQISLLLGALIAEGFIAVEAKDAPEVKKIGTAVLKVASALGVKTPALRRSSAIIEDAEKRDWAAVREEWDGVFVDVEGAMRELNSEQLSHLVSVGGWLRGTEALSALILQNYSPSETELLRQPASLDYFEKRMAEMDRRLRSKALVAKMQNGIRRIRPLVERDEGAEISKQAVEEIGAITRGLMEQINPTKR